MSTLVYGLGVAGEAVMAALRERQESVVVSDDHLTEAHRTAAAQWGAMVVEPGDEEGIDRVLEACVRLVPAPGIPEGHRILSRARHAGVEVVSEIELAYQWEQTRQPSPRPMVGITGTDGKTTTTFMAAAMLRQAGHRAEAVGNTDIPLIAALSRDNDVFAVECSSFRLAATRHFRCVASAWLNIAPDHLDWHSSFDSYESAKARLWSSLRSGDVAVAPSADPRILRHAANSAGRVVTFGFDQGDYHAQGGVLTSPHGPIIRAAEMKRSMPHDVTNALAAAAVCMESGLVSTEDIAEAMRHFEHAHHRIEFVGERDGVRWFNDSKATSPHAALVAIRAFESVVLIAGGRNKGLELHEMASEPARMRAVVATGESAPEVEAAFRDVCPVRRAESMQEAVAHAASFAVSGDVVLLSPGCTSFDWYRNYAERGTDYSQHVRTFIADQPNAQTTTNKGK